MKTWNDWPGLQQGRGYDAYDLVCDNDHCSDFLFWIHFLRAFQWDLGEFKQKGTVATRWGTKEELLSAVRVAKESGIDVLIDAVLNVSKTPRRTLASKFTQLLA